MPPLLAEAMAVAKVVAKEAAMEVVMEAAMTSPEVPLPAAMHRTGRCKGGRRARLGAGSTRPCLREARERAPLLARRAMRGRGGDRLRFWILPTLFAFGSR